MYLVIKVWKEITFFGCYWGCHRCSTWSATWHSWKIRKTKNYRWKSSLNIFYCKQVTRETISSWIILTWVEVTHQTHSSQREWALSFPHRQFPPWWLCSSCLHWSYEKIVNKIFRQNSTKNDAVFPFSLFPVSWQFLRCLRKTNFCGTHV